MLKPNDISILRELAMQYAEAASLPVHDEKRRLWTANNECRPARPMVLIDQICWQEINTDGALSGRAEDAYWRRVEEELKMKLYCWRHMPVDMVLTPYIQLPMPVSDSGWGLEVKEDVIAPDRNATAYSHRLYDVLDSEEALAQIRLPEYTLDREALKRIREEADVIFGGIIPYRMRGVSMHLGVWDKISFWRGVESCYIDLMDRPEFMHAIMEKLTRGLLHQIESANRQGIYDVSGTLTHCSHNFLSDLPEGESGFGTTGQGWAFGLAQLFSSVSPEITREFEVEYMKRVFPHFGAIYYGCCERLDDRLDVLAALPKVRKISCSPWSDRDHFAEALPEGKVMSAKPNPAFLATDSFDEEAVRRDLRATMDAARRHNRSLEFILKDISTIRRDPARLWRWAEIAMEEVQR
ncbi:MAG: hypothetical protein IJE08_16280 [Clostridia bacterium]|nr:hypothetical protein [Clostridia bacterium]